MLFGNGVYPLAFVKSVMPFKIVSSFVIIKTKLVRYGKAK